MKKEGASRWYVIYTRPKEEDRVDQNLAILQVETFSPKIKKRQLISFRGRPSISEGQCFPAMFLRVSSGINLHKILYTRGVQKLVSMNNLPVPVDDEVIDLIRSRVGEDGFVKLNDDLNDDLMTI